MRYTRNGECWCGSGKKYKHCHFEFDQKIVDLRLNGCLCPSHELIKNEKEIRAIKESAKINTGVLDAVAEKIGPGMSTAEIDKIVYDYTTAHHAIPGAFEL